MVTLYNIFALKSRIFTQFSHYESQYFYLLSFCESGESFNFKFFYLKNTLRGRILLLLGNLRVHLHGMHLSHTICLLRGVFVHKTSQVIQWGINLILESTFWHRKHFALTPPKIFHVQIQKNQQWRKMSGDNQGRRGWLHDFWNVSFI